MINLQVDECFAFDYLSILEIKNSFSKKHEESYINCCNNLKQQLDNKFDSIKKSQEYKNLLFANKKTFDAVEKARYGGDITAKEVDDCNMERYQAKVALQKEFFDGDIVEKKT
jgi:hypothetical protein